MLHPANFFLYRSVVVKVDVIDGGGRYYDCDDVAYDWVIITNRHGYATLFMHLLCTMYELVYERDENVTKIFGYNCLKINFVQKRPNAWLVEIVYR